MAKTVLCGQGILLHFCIINQKQMRQRGNEGIRLINVLRNFSWDYIRETAAVQTSTAAFSKSQPAVWPNYKKASYKHCPTIWNFSWDYIRETAAAQTSAAALLPETPKTTRSTTQSIQKYRTQFWNFSWDYIRETAAAQTSAAALLPEAPQTTRSTS